MGHQTWLVVIRRLHCRFDPVDVDLTEGHNLRWTIALVLGGVDTLQQVLIVTVVTGQSAAHIGLASVNLWATTDCRVGVEARKSSGALTQFKWLDRDLVHQSISGVICYIT